MEILLDDDCVWSNLMDFDCALYGNILQSAKFDAQKCSVQECRLFGGRLIEWLIILLSGEGLLESIGFALRKFYKVLHLLSSMI